MKSYLDELNIKNKSKIDTNLIIYQENFNNYVMYHKIKGLNENLGLEGVFRDKAHDLEKILSDLKLNKMQVLQLQLRRREKDYLLRGEEKYIDMVIDHISEIKKMTKQLNLSTKHVQNITTIADDYAKAFIEVTDVINQIEMQRSSLNNIQSELQAELNLYYTEITEKVDTVNDFLILFFIFSILGATFFSVQLSRGISKPIAILKKTSQKISGNDLTVRADIHTDDEIGELAIAFNTMLDKLEEAYNDIELAKNTLEERVSERTYALQKEIEERKVYEEKLKETFLRLSKVKTELSEALSKERELNELKSRFVSMVSHEYRTPLTVLQSSGFILKKFFEKGDEKAFDERIKKMEITINGMKRLLEDTLTLDKIESGKIDVEIEEVNLKDLVNYTLNSLEEVKKPGQNISFIHIEHDPIIQTDPNLLKHCLSNLTTNAIKYSPESSLIDVELNEFHQGYQLKVKNNGIGIPKQDQ